MTDRARDAATIPIDLQPISSGQIVSGEPRAGFAEVGSIDGISVGVWSHTVGVSTDVEVDEVSVILSGDATVVINDTETVRLVAGTLLQLTEGDRTVWTVTETLRKVYVVRA